MNLKYATALANLEQERRPIVEATRDRLARAIETLPERTEDVETAREAVDDIEQAWRSVTSDIDPTPESYAAAQAAIVRAELRHKAALVEVERAQKGVRTTDTRAALIVADVVQRAYGSVPVHTTFVDPRSVKPRVNETPLIVVAAKDAPVLSGAGTVSGSCEIVLYREDGIHTPLDHKRVFAAAESLHVQMRDPLDRIGGPVQSAAVGGSLMRDVLTIEIRDANPEGLPIISIPDRTSRAVANKLAHLITDKLRTQGTHVTSTPLRGNFYLSSDRVSAMPHEMCLVSEELDEETGERVIVVDSSVLVRRRPHPSGGSTVADTSQAVAALEGEMVPGLGVVEKVERLSEGSDLFLSEMAVQTLTDQMRTSEKPRNFDQYSLEAERFGRRQVVVRTTHRSRISG